MAQYDYEKTLFSYLDNLKHQLSFRPLNLGGVSGEFGGQSGPPGGFTGMLPQGRVAYDTVEAETLYTTPASSGVGTYVTSYRKVYPQYNGTGSWLLVTTPGPLNDFAYVYPFLEVNDTSQNNLFWPSYGLRTTTGISGYDVISGIFSGTWKFNTYFLPYKQMNMYGNYWESTPPDWYFDLKCRVNRVTISGAVQELFHANIGHIKARDSVLNPMGHLYMETEQPYFPMAPTDKLEVVFYGNVVNPISDKPVEIHARLGGVTDDLFFIQAPSSLGYYVDSNFNNPDSKPIVGTSLVDNLNHIRGRIALLEHEDKQAIYTFEGTAISGASPIRIYNFVKPRKISKVAVSLSTAPQGQVLIADIHKNGTTIFTNQNARPTVSGGANYGYSTNIQDSVWNVNDYLVAYIDQIGTTVAGESPVVYVVYE
jgi:hypothetical protein